MVEISICIGSSCHLKGSYNLIQILQQLIEENSLHDQVEMNAQFCMKHCQNGVSVSIGEELFSVSPDTAHDFFNSVVKEKVKLNN